LTNPKLKKKSINCYYWDWGRNSPKWSKEETNSALL